MSYIGRSEGNTEHNMLNLYQEGMLQPGKTEELYMLVKMRVNMEIIGSWDSPTFA